MINPFRDTNWNPDLAARREFAKTLMIGLPLVAGVLALLTRWQKGVWLAWPWWLGGIGGAVGLLLLAVPKMAKPFYLAWNFAACCVGIVVSNVALALVFFLVVTPVGLALRLLGKDPMSRKLDRRARSYWNAAERVTDPERYFRQF
jgi:hypothetical protein